LRSKALTNRIDEIEGTSSHEYYDQADQRGSGLHRQNELTIKEPFRVVLDRQGGKTVLDILGLGGSFVPADNGEPEEEKEEKADEINVSTEDAVDSIDDSPRRLV
jgi:hypothetical protein